jgi:flagellar basal body-associated protein FliL
VRKNGSILIALISGAALIVLGIATLASKNLFGFEMLRGEQIINAIVSIIFGGVLLYWVFSYATPEKDKNKQPKPNEMINICEALQWKDPSPTKTGHGMFDIFYSNGNWGIGFETVTMVVTVIAAVVVIFTFTHERFKQTDEKILHQLESISGKLGAHSTLPEMAK